MSHDVQDFQTEVIERSRETPVLVDFWAPWCGPCRTLGPVLDKLATQAGGRWELAKVNTEEHQELAMAHDIRSIPAVKLFVDGKVQDEFLGALPEAEIRRWLDRNLPSPLAGAVSEARRLVSEGAHLAARESLARVIEAEPGNDEARLLYAECLLLTEPGQVAAVLEPIDASSEAADRANALRALARTALRAKQADALPPGQAPDRFLAGARAIGAGDWATALEALVEAIERDKSYADGAAPEACRAIFAHLGVRHPIAERFHRRFSSALHS